MRLLTFASLLGVFLVSHMVQASDNVASRDQSAPISYQYTAKDYGYLLGKVPGFSDDALKMHFKLYQGYVNNTNILLQKIRGLDKSAANASEFAGLKHMLGWEFDGMLLHEYYFENLGGTTPLSEKDPLFAKMKAEYGSFEGWKADFVATGLMRGIGWVVAYIEPKDGRLVNVWINEHDLGHLAGAKPLLIMDVFEHAYITQFGLDRAKYIDVFFSNIQWPVVSMRFRAGEKIGG